MKKLKFIESESLHILEDAEKVKLLGGGWSCNGYEITPSCLAFHTCGKFYSPGTGICSKHSWYTEIDFPICSNKEK